jgi:hypothetical protein
VPDASSPGSLNCRQFAPWPLVTNRHGIKTCFKSPTHHIKFSQTSAVGLGPIIPRGALGSNQPMHTARAGTCHQVPTAASHGTQPTRTGKHTGCLLKLFSFEWVLFFSSTPDRHPIVIRRDSGLSFMPPVPVRKHVGCPSSLPNDKHPLPSFARHFLFFTQAVNFLRHFAG